MEGLADLASGLVLSIFVRVCCCLADEEDKSKRHGYSQQSGFSPWRL